MVYMDFSAISAHTRIVLELLKTEAVIIIACDGRLLLLLLLSAILSIQRLLGLPLSHQYM
jgi:hypothetical protein